MASFFKKPGNYWFIVPWIAFIPWYGMLIAMLACWAAQGHPIYWFMDTDQFPVFISDIGATNLKPLFIACAGWQGIGYVITLCLEFLQRYNGWMNPWFTRDERNLIIASIVLGSIGELGILFCSIFTTASYHHVHIAMLTIFIVFMFLSLVCLTTEYYLMGFHYTILRRRNISRDVTMQSDGETIAHWNKFLISAIFKTLWLVCAVIWAVSFATVSGDSKSAAFEWLLAFWLGVIFIIISIDFYLGSQWKTSKHFPYLNNFGTFYKFQQYKEKHPGLYTVESEVNSKSSSGTLVLTDVPTGQEEVAHQVV
ncbi:similar to Saccharomyces cerevisiae YKL051W SFK1 Plasma membrane protein that may act together with or upstream of Stt4p to generate normal levels of the essential phospholipid PI4P [Maudiozyma barnettii]|uniref:Similar to Saccharomyces cerevisiae YKL051W SFK1 Plasma membrane protein that may act together with or upstream of Stt4p to generate normal levels of the essential phospholipid PI4P n=1 Tax=Maudiozyma barnettii TaxID=61262 RepID=A0A8H2ZJ01_9SACH|nr:Sfk1p [Kazachstania barnettii]CAB4256433.1 similar to Saccharomyces cerevisiae YKL051W SFK1 Plasma membrane protein that may act together with or upstream of Stt4p to generate normal levels of the essential phospholipid PI4P [Kazachstania barnettii]CAD1785042.1 similar to Saccharomyces cerevisiae YKL051W SFK1 Plasma membrane protein that may act together with or upstream of Stt4p to generate normal levels of the essential phospholipid PI4P [Kazachstania barnettii]